MPEYDIVIRGASVIDGTGAPARTADVAVVADRIVAVGPVPDGGRVEYDADGLLLTPGFVDIHTHYDGQATWEQRLMPSSAHGVTTAVLGNCGVGFAPVRASDRDAVIQLMEGVEDIPGAVLHEGLQWRWESFRSYLDVLDETGRDMDVAAYLPHSPLRVYVMGKRALAGQPATDADIAAMARLAAEAVNAGALGFATSRTTNHRSATGEHIPSFDASGSEITQIAEAIGRTGRGVFQVVSDFADPEAEFELVRRMSVHSGRPVSYSLLQYPNEPDLFRSLLARTAAARSDGVPVSAQVAPRGPGLLMGLDTTFNPWLTNPVYQTVAGLPVPERLAIMRDPAFRAKMLAATNSGPPDRTKPVSVLVKRYERMYELGDPPDYEPPPARSIAARAAREGCSEDEVVYDILTSGDGSALLYLPIGNYAGGNLNAVAEMLEHPHTVIGLGDGGAHVGFICDASFPTTVLTHWGRDRAAGTFPLEDLVQRQTQAAALAVGLVDRGVIDVGFQADLNIIDFDALRLSPPHIARSLPTGGRRFLQRADGYRHTFVRGVETYCNGEATGALPGRVVRTTSQEGA